MPASPIAAVTRPRRGLAAVLSRGSGRSFRSGVCCRACTFPHMAALRGTRIRHLVAFTLRPEEDSPAGQAFMVALRSLAAIEGVEELELVRQIGVKNPYQFAVVMEFASRAAYDAYNGHPDHVAFVNEVWDVEVSDFMEIDLAPLDAVAIGEE